MAASSPLFPASLISAEIVSWLPAGFSIRPLEKSDFGKGFVQCLGGLTWMGDVTVEQLEARYDDMDTQGKGPYYYAVIEHQGRIVGTGAVIVEKKFIQNCALVGHVEEICVSEQHRGKGLGLAMLRALDSVAAKVGCSKSILNCSPNKEAFYVKCGYGSSGMEMQHRFGDAETGPAPGS
ncbi:acetyltransferase (GNAT) family protein [Hirsutella rhossiliensis]|uniref:Glucosamine 6-phosphate N-acetyltransferase n=1 Tax=Hirsutella rhossiliensis TaxID=111463 RepID=A0A9P8MQY6_9HYPO|nr:acetyltransferase (GNAT) family domain-containing protein [Hirsutella rhossiliensis]KAH0960173.1 acetyltransferase (GNAT) family domain-containing protein [Hirsutella rhossiliensis]